MTLKGRYELLQPPLGVGSFGAVYLANDQKMPRQVAVKILHAAYASDAKVSARFLRELVAACRVSHENVIQVLDVDDDSEHGLFYVMEYAEGVSLEERLDGDPLPWHALRVVALQLAAALHAIHGAGIVHRDLKPRNIMLVERSSQDDLVKVLDFGIAAIHEEGDAGAGDVELTGTRMVVGTPPYMSPEQTYMKSDRERLGLVVDGRSDLYALGVILYEMLVGQRPFDGDAHELALAHRHEPPPSMAGHVSPDVPRGFCDLVQRLLAKAPDERPATAQHVLATLRSLGAEEGRQISPGGKRLDAQESATCIVDAVKVHAQDAATLNSPAVSFSTLATEAEEDVDYSSVRRPRAPMLAGVVVLCAAVSWVVWPSPAPGPDASEVVRPPAVRVAEPAADQAPGDAQSGDAIPPVAESSAVVSLMVTSVPPGAEVLLDGVVLGKTPLTTTIPTEREGKHLLEIQREGYGLRQVPIAVAPHLAGKALVFNEVLAPESRRRASKPNRKHTSSTAKGNASSTSKSKKTKSIKRPSPKKRDLFQDL